MLGVGIDIGGTKIAGGVVDTDGRILDHLRVATPPDTDALARRVRHRLPMIEMDEAISLVFRGN